MDAILDSLDDLTERRSEEYHALVGRVLAGEEVPADDIELACLRAKKDPSDFVGEIRTRQRRVGERAKVDGLDELQQQLSGVDSEIGANAAKLESARQLHDAEYWRLSASRDALRGEIANLNALKASIGKSCGDEALIRQAKSLAIHLESNRRQRSEAFRNLQTQMAILRQGADASLERFWFDRDARSQPLPKEVAEDAPFRDLKLRVLRAAAVVDHLDAKAEAYQAEIEQNIVDEYAW